MRAAREIEVIGVGQYADDAGLKITGRRLDETGQDVLFRWQGQPVQTRLPLIGAFQAMNVLTAAGLVIAAGEEPDAVFAVLPRLTGVRGRMQMAGRRANGAAVLSITPIRPMRWRPRSRRCARM
jgi:UDP-N-acetylmuramoyl-L-alanyl-D-glutamate--2,6-diaminopimelate ligase